MTTKFTALLLLFLGHATLVWAAPFREELTKTSLQYFLDNANPVTGLVRDTAHNTAGIMQDGRRASIASTGFGLAVIANASEQGLVDREWAKAYLAKVLSFVQGQMQERKGWLFHFVDWETGQRWEKSEYSTIDTALFLAGALYAGQVFPGTAIDSAAQALYARLDFNDMRTEGGAHPDKLILTSSFRPELGYSKFQWKNYAEASVLYLLGLGHPTNPLPSASWTAWERESKELPPFGNVVGYDKPLFTHQYSQLFVDFRGLKDGNVNYFDNATRATLYNRRVSKNDHSFLTFREGFWGLSAGDAPKGYAAYSPSRYEGTVCPGCAVASAMFLPDLVLGEAERWFSGPHGTAIWGRYGFADSINLDQNWISEKVHGITVGPIFLALANLTEHSVWSRFNQIPGIQRGLRRAGMVRKTTDLKEGWRFIKGQGSATVEGLDFSGAERVTLPHTWNALDGQLGAHYYRGTGWYQRAFTVDPTSGQEIFLRVGAANEVAEVFLNGQRIGEHRGGYTAFAFKLTPFLKKGGVNTLTLRVDNSGHEDVAPIEADFPFYGGLYRDVSLISTAHAHVSLVDFGSPGVYLTPLTVSPASAVIAVRTVVSNETPHAAPLTLVTSVIDREDTVVAKVTSPLSANAGGDTSFVQNVTLDSPHLWEGTRDPYLYRVAVQVINVRGEAIDRVEQPLGVRKFSIDGASGSSLNDHAIELNGVSLHQDWEGKGWAIGPTQRSANLAIIKEIGANAVRLCHYPHSPEELRLYDEAGILAWSEIPLVNVVHTSAAFAETTKLQLREMIHQLYNHPSIVLWGLYNEIKSDPNHLVNELNDIAHRADPSRLTTAATDRTADESFNHITDVLAFNRYDGWYHGKWSDFGAFLDAQKARFGSKPLGVSEYGAGASLDQHEEPPRQPASGSHFHPEEWQNAFHEAYFTQLKQRPNLFGHFLWNLFDFAAPHRNEGEKIGMNDKGLVAYDRRTKKDTFYFYRAQWNPSPLVYLTGRRFVDRPGQVVNVKVYSNLKNVDLRVNGQSIGTPTSVEGVTFLWKQAGLRRGPNLIEVSGAVGGKTYSDRATWTVR